MKICIAQTKSIKGNVEKNIENHKKLIAIAVSCNADAVFFPELSITGYEPTLANDLAVEESDTKFNLFQEMADTNNIAIGIGMPTKFGKEKRISMLLFQPKKTCEVYAKQQLHTDELPYFTNGTAQTILKIDNQIIAPAICYESLQEDHCLNAYNLGATIYMASVAKSKNGLDKADIHYPKIAKKYGLIVLMANCVGFCDDFQSVGNRTIWDKKGVVKGRLNSKNQGLLIYDTETASVIERIL
jgi:predicted amidohydrolase